MPFDRSTAGPEGVEVFGRRRAREGLPPVKPQVVRLAKPGSVAAPDNLLTK
jgi:hypothetical protein